MIELGSTPAYFVGIDAALRADHVAVILDERCRTVGKKITFGHCYHDLQDLRKQVYQAIPPQAQVVWGCEATGAAWRPLTAYLGNEGESFSFLPKPFTLKGLATMVKETLGR